MFLCAKYPCRVSGGGGERRLGWVGQGYISREAVDTEAMRGLLQGYLAYTKTHPPRILPEAYA